MPLWASSQDGMGARAVHGYSGALAVHGYSGALAVHGMLLVCTEGGPSGGLQVAYRWHAHVHKQGYRWATATGRS